MHESNKTDNDCAPLLAKEIKKQQPIANQSRRYIYIVINISNCPDEHHSNWFKPVARVISCDKNITNSA